MRRGPLEIIIEILEAIENEGKTTNIMFKTRLSYNLLKEKLNFIVKSGLAEIKENPEWRGGAREKRRYILTEKGRKLLYHGREIRKLLDWGED